MKKYAFSLQMEQKFSSPITKHSFILRFMPGTYPFQRSYAHSFRIKPNTALTAISDVFGNEMFSGTIDKAHDSFSVTASGFVLASKYLTHDPLDRMYLHPTANTRYTDGMRLLVQHLDLPTNELARVRMLCRKTAKMMTLVEEPGVRSAAEAFARGKGNSTDICHVFLALCRLAGLPARLVSGLAVGHTSFHTWAEVYCGNAWRAFDPTTGELVEQGYLKIANGPDFDVCNIARSCFREKGTEITTVITASVTEHVVLTRDTVPHA